MTRQAGVLINEDHLRQGSPANATFVESVPRWAAGSDVAIAATGIELAVGIPLNAGDLVTNITYITGGTAAGTPTNQYVCLRTAAGALLAQSADATTTARAANTAFTIALATPQLITVPGLYYIGIAFAATTVPTLRGAALGNAAVAGAAGLSMRILAQSHGSGLTATAPATIATPTTTATIPYLVVT